MGKIIKWSGVQGTWSREFTDEDEKPKCLKDMKLPDWYEIVVEFKSSGYSDPGCISGPVERCYPPEGDDERELEEAYINDEDRKIELSKEIQEKVFDEFSEEIQEVELSNDGPDYDDRDD